MEGAAEFLTRAQETAKRLLEVLETPEAAEGMTSVRLAAELRVPKSVLFVALGALLRDGAVEIAPQGLTYLIRKHGAPSLSDVRS